MAAKKVQSFKLDEAKKTIVIYTNVAQSETEKMLIELYLKAGYIPMIDTKSGLSVEQMRKELDKTDKKALAEFEKIYSEKGGFHNACKYYTKWKNENKIKAIREELKTYEEAAKEFERLLGKEYEGFKDASLYYRKWKKENTAKK
jgi:hypothetical protein